MPAEPTETGLSRPARWSAVMDLLATRGRLSVTEAAEQLGVSEATIRRDFTELARRQLVDRQHGGVVATSVAYELPYRYRSRRGDETLDRIAEFASGLAEPGQVIALNGGATTTATARAITSRDDLQGGDGAHPLTLVTNALNIASEAVLRPQVRCVSLGGVARPESYELTGPLAAMVASQLWFDLAIVGVEALSATAGATCRHEDEAAIVRLMIERSRKVAVVTAQEKLGQRTFASICPTNEIDVLITDAAETDSQVAALRARGVTVHCV